MRANEKIRYLREHFDLTQEQMATKLGLSTNGYANLERGETKLDVERLEQIANVFGIDFMELMNFGERHTIMNNHSTHNWNIIGSASQVMLEAEIDKLKMTIAHKDEVIAFLKRENDTLRLLVEPLKSQI